MQILHFVRGYKCRLATNAVVLVLGGYKISIAKNLRGYLPHVQFERDRLNTFRVKSVHVV